MPTLSSSEKFAETVSQLAAAGARSVLIVGASDRTMALSAAGLVDQVIAYLPHTPHSRTTDNPEGFLTAIPEGYRLAAVHRHGDYVRLVGTRG
ncbi:hypothetical protein Sm713_65820 [Streptomyces sp. TS71-3]|nr:hypothetical protein Sm713_65820 [Streptomyces sp. TS71-3]